MHGPSGSQYSPYLNVFRRKDRDGDWDTDTDTDTVTDTDTDTDGDRDGNGDRDRVREGEGGGEKDGNRGRVESSDSTAFGRRCLHAYAHIVSSVVRPLNGTAVPCRGASRSGRRM